MKLTDQQQRDIIDSNYSTNKIVELAKLGFDITIDPESQLRTLWINHEMYNRDTLKINTVDEFNSFYMGIRQGYKICLLSLQEHCIKTEGLLPEIIN